MKQMLKIVPILILAAIMIGCTSLPISFGSNQPPKAYIDSITPSNAAAGSKIIFSGHGTDVDGTVVAYRWQSSINGDLGTTASFDTTRLALGTHIIYFKVQDNTGNWSEEVRDRITVSEGGGTPSGSPPVITSFFAAPGNISPGGSATISWNVSNATAVSIDNGIGTVAAAGSTSVSPAATTLYTISATNASGSMTAATQIIIGPALSGLPTINSFIATPAAILLGGSTILSWNVTGATAVFIDKGIGPVAPVDTKSVSPAATTTYTLTATNATGTRIQSATVTVNKLFLPLPLFPFKPIKTTGALPNLASERGGIQKEATYQVYAGSCAGDTVPNGTRRGFLSFDISSIPAGSTITEAILDLAYTKDGNPTFATLGFFEVYFYEYGNYASLQANPAIHYNTTGQLVKGGRYSIYPLSPWKVNVEETSTSVPLLQNMLGAGKDRCQFKVQFATATDGDNVLDFFCFSNATLTIKYTEP